MGKCIMKFDVSEGVCVHVNIKIFTTKFKRNADDDDYKHKTHLHVQLNYRM